jgi:hypothetical protein
LVEEHFETRRDVMNDFKKRMLAAAALSLLAVIGTIMNARQASAQDQGNGPTKVTIVSPVPLPVTGSVTGTVTGNVGVTGTVGLASGASVHVNNTLTDPVRVRNVNDAIQPFQVTVSCLVPASACSAGGYTVPMGKRAVIEYVSGKANGSGSFDVAPSLQTMTGGVTVEHELTSSTAPRGTSTWGQQLRLYADPGSSINPSVFTNPSTNANFTFTISGYLVDVPFAP